jgi:hypothetical protein
MKTPMPTVSSPHSYRFRRVLVFIALISSVCMTLGGCGLSADIHPRDIDPAKQDLLRPSTTTVATQDTANP